MPKPDKITQVNEQSIARLNTILEEMWDLTNGRYQLNIITSNPDGSIRGNTGDMLLLNNSGTYYLEINVGGTVWRGTAITDLP